MLTDGEHFCADLMVYWPESEFWKPELFWSWKMNPWVIGIGWQLYQSFKYIIYYGHFGREGKILVIGSATYAWVIRTFFRHECGEYNKYVWGFTSTV